MENSNRELHNDYPQQATLGARPPETIPIPGWARDGLVLEVGLDKKKIEKGKIVPSITNLCSCVLNGEKV